MSMLLLLALVATVATIVVVVRSSMTHTTAADDRVSAYLSSTGYRSYATNAEPVRDHLPTSDLFHARDDAAGRRLAKSAQLDRATHGYRGSCHK